MSVASNTETCFDIKKITVIAKELATAFKQDICSKEIRPVHVQWIVKNALPKIMNQSFLGVNPPPNWQALADEIMHDCIPQGDLCVSKEQKEFVECLQIKTPIILLQLSPWVAENCEKINKTVVDNWDNKKDVVIGLIVQFNQRK